MGYSPIKSLIKTGSALRRVVKKTHSVLQTIKFKLAKDKTFIGKICRGFDFLRYRFGRQGIIGLAAKTIQNFLDRIKTSFMSKGRIQFSPLWRYVKGWKRWCLLGLAG